MKINDIKYNTMIVESSKNALYIILAGVIIASMVVLIGG